MIDFEYSSYNPRAFDLANHVCEHYIDYACDQWPGFVIDEQRFPSDFHIRRLITAYLYHYKKYTVRRAAHARHLTHSHTRSSHKHTTSS